MSKVILAISLCVCALIAQAQHIDLRGGSVVDKGFCLNTKMKPTSCLIVVFQEKVYSVLYDQKGELEIFLIEGEKASLVWSSGSI